MGQKPPLLLCYLKMLAGNSNAKCKGPKNDLGGTNKNFIHPCKHFRWPQLGRSAKFIGLTLKCPIEEVSLLSPCVPAPAMLSKIPDYNATRNTNFHQMSLVTPGCKCQHANLPTCQHAYMPTCHHANLLNCLCGNMVTSCLHANIPKFFRLNCCHVIPWFRQF